MGRGRREQRRANGGGIVNFFHKVEDKAKTFVVQKAKNFVHYVEHPQDFLMDKVLPALARNPVTAGLAFGGEFIGHMVQNHRAGLRGGQLLGTSTVQSALDIGAPKGAGKAVKGATKDTKAIQTSSRGIDNTTNSTTHRTSGNIPPQRGTQSQPQRGTQSHQGT
jgi:hypothetical protein